VDEQPQPDTETQDAATPAGGGRLLPVIGLVVALAAGGGAGYVGVRRVVSAGRVAAAASGEPKKATETTPLYQLENLVVNPQGTKGARFLIVSVALQPEKPSVIEDLKRLDPELRDAYGHVLAGKTVDELSDIGRRDSLKAELKRVTDVVVGPHAIADVFLPQFVLQ